MMKNGSLIEHSRYSRRGNWWCMVWAWAALTGVAGGCSQSQRTEVILVRHAEKAADPGNFDPDLTPAGVARSQALAERLADTPLQAVYATPWKRNRQTATTVAQAKNVTLKIDDRASRELARHILSEHAGETVLVVGHSNTIPELIRAFGCNDQVVIKDQEYDDLFRVMVDADGKVALTRETYGKLTPVE